MKSISTAIAILMLALHLVLPAESRATVSGMCSLTPENGDIDFRCDVASDDPSMDDNLYSHVGVSVFRFWAPYFAAYPNQWNDATIYNVAVQGAGTTCNPGYHGIDSVQFRRKLVAGGAWQTFFGPANFGPAEILAEHCE